MKCTLLIDRKELLAMRAMQSEEESRYVLCGVRFEVTKDSVILVATDGRKMAILKSSASISDLDGDMAGFTVNYPMVRWLPKGKLDKITVELDGEQVSFSSDGQRVVSKAIDGNYPSWRGVVPKGEMVPKQFQFNVDFFNSFAVVSRLLRPKQPPYVTLRGHEGDNAAYSVFIGDPRFYGILMPLKDGGETIPEWVK